MSACDFALYDAFSENRFGGSQAAIIADAAGIAADQRQTIAREIGMPATAFVDACGDDWIQVQFISNVMELPMCGHGTICLLTHLFETGVFNVGRGEFLTLELRLPKTQAMVEVSRRQDNRYRVLLDIAPPTFEAPPHTGELLPLLGIEASALAEDLPLETARGDFVHLVVPLTGLDAMSAIRPDFNGIVGFCRAHGIETIAVFCREVINPEFCIHVRDFCPAVGVAESAAAGTTNAALSSYLVRHQLVALESEIISVNAEQGFELGRPSAIQSRLKLVDKSIKRLQVGGVASKVMDGQIYL